MPSPVDAHPLLDREPEIAALEGACHETTAGAGRVLAVEGPAGIGKTALLGEARRAAGEAGLRVLVASGAELERDLAFGVARQLFERHLRDLTPDARRELLSGAAAHAEPVLLDSEPALTRTRCTRRSTGSLAIARSLATAFDRAVADEFVDACAAATGGNPFLLRELAMSLVSDRLEPDASAAAAVAGIAPASIARAVLVRLAPLGAEAVAVAEAAATLSTDARLDRVATLAGIPVARAAELADQLAAAGILDEGDPLLYRHPILRSSVHEQIPALRRGLAHAGAAQLLLDDGLGPERAASHLLATPAGGREWVVATLRKAAATALARGAPEAAVSLLRRALDEGDGARAETLIELSAAEFTVQDPAAVEHGLAAMAAATTPRLRTEAGLAAARALTPLGRYDEAFDALRVVEHEAEHLDTAAQQAARYERLVLTSWHRGVTVLTAPLTSLGVDELPGNAPEQRLLIALGAMEAVSRGQARADTLELGRRVLDRADAEDRAEESAVLMAARSIMMADAIDAAEPVFTMVVDSGRARGPVATVATACAMRAEARVRAGKLPEAESDGREALALAAHDLRVGIPAALTVLVDVLLDRAGTAPAAELLADYDGFLLPAGYPTNMIRFARGRVAAATGDLETAAAELEACRAGRGLG